MFTAYLVHDDLSADIAYFAFPGTASAADLATKADAARAGVTTIRNDGSISAAVDAANGPTAFGVFWETDGGTFTVPALAAGEAPVKIQSTGSACVILKMDADDGWTVTVADPTQLLASLTLTFTLGSGTAPAGWGTAETKTVAFTLPSDGVAGSSLTQALPL